MDGSVTDVKKDTSKKMHPEIPTRDELIERARAMVPTLIERAPECEKLRRAPDETIEDFKQAGFFKIGLPKKYGGYEMDYDVLCEVIMEVAHGCGSSAWNLAVLGEHNYTLTNSSAEVLDELWAEDPDVLLSSGNDPQAELESVEGGFIFNARLKFSSGCDHASWWMCRGVEKESGQPRGVIIPKEHATIIDESWQVAGLAGSGSKDVEFKNVFIPTKHLRSPPMGPDWGGNFADVQNPATYRLSQQSTKPFTLTSVSVGIAGGVLQAFTQQMKERYSRFGDGVAGFQSMQLRVAESAAEYHAARMIVLNDIQESLAILKDNEDIPAEMHHRNRRDMAYCPRLAAASVDRLFYAAGAGGLFLDGNLQRQFRDVHAGGAQVFLNWDINATVYGRALLGLEPGGPPAPGALK
jgi:alkylation response protein AidB-like acyl-CoA dehydrogenase